MTQDVVSILGAYAGGVVIVGGLFLWIWWGNRHADDNSDER